MNYTLVQVSTKVSSLGEAVLYKDINLYDHTLNDAVVEPTLKGRQITVTNTEHALDLATRGLFPKAWIRTDEWFRLLKDDGEDIVQKEILTSMIRQCFNIPQVKYQKHYYQNQFVSESDIISLAPRNVQMNILDYLIGNTD